MKQIKDGIYKIEIPFYDIYTSSFILIKGDEAVILDSGNCEKDAEDYVIPAVEALGVTPKYLVSSHTHQDHHGGLPALRRAYPMATAALFAKEAGDSYQLTDGEVLLERFQVLNLKGHSEDSLAVYDMETKSIITCDCLQLYGVSKWRNGISDKDAYFQSIERVRGLYVDTIIASHEYDPLGSIAEGDMVKEYLKVCEEAAGKQL